MEILPTEIILLIFSFLDPFTRPTARLVNHPWRSLIIGTMHLFHKISRPRFEQKMTQLGQMQDQLALKFDFNRHLEQDAIQNSLTKLRNLVVLDLSNLRQLGISLSARSTVLDRLERLKIFRPPTDVIKALTRIKQLDMQYDFLNARKFDISTTIEDFAFTSVIRQEIDPDSLFQLTEHHSRLTRAYFACDISNLIGGFSSLTKLTNLRDLHILNTGIPRPKLNISGLNLMSLYICGVTISTEDIASLTKLTKLVWFDDVDVEQLAQLTNLRSIDISYNKANTTFWTALTNLEDINTSSVKETGSALPYLPSEKLTKLAFTIAKGGYQNKNIEDNINRLSHLKTLRFHVQTNFECKTGISLPNLSNLSLTLKCHSIDLRELPSLKILSLRLNQPLQKLDLPTKLEQIGLYSSKSNNIEKPVRAEILPNLASMTRLKKLLVCWPNGSVDVVHENISQMTQLENLSINMENSTLDEELLQSLTNLTTLDIDTNLKNNSGNGSFMSGMTQLQKLVLTQYACNNECIIGLSKFGNLTHLAIPKSLGDIQFESAIRLTNLQYLCLKIEYEQPYYDLRDNLQAKLPYLKEYQPS